MKRMIAPLIISYLLIFPVFAQSNELFEAVTSYPLGIERIERALKGNSDPNYFIINKNGSRQSVLSNFVLRASVAVAYDGENERNVVKILEELFRKGAKIQGYDYRLLGSPIMNGQVLMTKVLLENGMNPNTRSAGDSFIELATEYNQPEIIELLVSFGAEELNSKATRQLQFIGAIKENDIKAMEACLKEGARINESDNSGTLPLVIALKNIATKDAYETTKFLLKKGADPNKLGSSGFQGWRDTPALHMAVFLTQSYIKHFKERSFIEKIGQPNYGELILKEILKAGAFVSGMDKDGKTPLHIAAQWNNLLAAEILLENGAKIMAKDNFDKRPLDYAESGEMIELLKKHGAKE